VVRFGGRSDGVVSHVQVPHGHSTGARGFGSFGEASLRSYHRGNSCGGGCGVGLAFEVGRVCNNEGGDISGVVSALPVFASVVDKR
jgi:hypothetical protein